MFYDKYAQLCKQKGVSKSAAATEAGLSKSLVTKWKTNKVEVPSPDVLKKLSTYFNLPVSELLGEEPELPQNEEKPTNQSAGELSEIKRQSKQKFDAILLDCTDAEANALLAMSEAFLASLRQGSVVPREEDSQKNR